MHAKAGVEQGLRKIGTPVEVMGMLVGRPDLKDRDAMIVSDVRSGTMGVQRARGEHGGADAAGARPAGVSSARGGRRDQSARRR